MTLPETTRVHQSLVGNFRFWNERDVEREAFEECGFVLGHIRGRPDVWGKSLVYMSRLLTRMGEGTSVSATWCYDHWTTALEDSRIPFYP